MANSEIEICNLALSHLGNGNTIEDIRNPKKAEEQKLLVWYDTIRRTVLRRYAPNFSVKRDIWALSSTVPAFEYSYAYLIPKDCLMPLSIGTDYKTNEKLKGVVEGGYFLTNEYYDSGLPVRYVHDETDVSKYDDTTVKLMAIELAIATCMSITNGRDLTVQLYEMRNQVLNEASVLKLSENPIKVVSKSKFTTVKRTGVY